MDRVCIGCEPTPEAIYHSVVCIPGGQAIYEGSGLYTVKDPTLGIEFFIDKRVPAGQELSMLIARYNPNYKECREQMLRFLIRLSINNLEPEVIAAKVLDYGNRAYQQGQTAKAEQMKSALNLVVTENQKYEHY